MEVYFLCVEGPEVRAGRLGHYRVRNPGSFYVGPPRSQHAASMSWSQTAAQPETLRQHFCPLPLRTLLRSSIT